MESSAGRVGLRPWVRVLLVWVVTAIALDLLAWVFPGFEVDGPGPALAAAALLGIVNALVWPLLVRLALPLTVITLGLAPLLLNGVVVLVIGDVVPGVQVHGFGWAMAVAVGLTAVSMGLTSALALDDDEMFFRDVRRRTRGTAAGASTDVCGLVVIQIDGLSHPVLRRAMRDGNAPTLAGWLASGSHTLTAWETDWSSQTGVSQAGILLGSNDDMPAFRWLEKETGRLFVSNHPRSAAEIERRHSNGKGLLHNDGASRGNIFTGDAADAVLTMSSVGRKRGRVGAGYYSYFSHPYAAMRTLIGTVAEAFREVHQGAVQRRRDVRPRVHRGGVYPLLRAFVTVVTRDVIVATIIGDMAAGRSVVYADFVGYDEVAHHSGVERYDALETLRRLDRELGRLERASRLAARPYQFVVLSDHGQSQGATFRTRYGETLADVVDRAVETPVAVPAGAGGSAGSTRSAGEESWGYAGGAVEEIAAGTSLPAKVFRRFARGRQSDPGSDVLLGKDRGDKDLEPSAAEPAVVLASGNCALVYLTRHPQRLKLEQITKEYPKLVPALVDHPGVGFVLVDSDRGGLVLGAQGTRELASGTVTGVDPLGPFGASAARQVARTHGFPHCADLMLNSLWDEQTDEVAAFEELVGSHGGLGGEQTRPFLLHPRTLPAPGALHGAVEVHRQLRAWLHHLGQPGHAPGDVDGSATIVRPVVDERQDR